MTTEKEETEEEKVLHSGHMNRSGNQNSMQISRQLCVCFKISHTFVLVKAKENVATLALLATNHVLIQNNTTMDCFSMMKIITQIMDKHLKESMQNISLTVKKELPMHKPMNTTTKGLDRI